MKSWFTLVFILLCCFLANAQNGKFEVKVFTSKYKPIKGQLKVVNTEGIGIEDYMGKYYIFRVTDIVKIKVKKRGLTVGEGASKGALAGVALGAGIWSLDMENAAFDKMAVLTASLAASGATIGTISGAIAERINNKLTVRVNNNMERFILNYKKLEPFINTSVSYTAN